MLFDLKLRSAIFGIALPLAATTSSPQAAAVGPFVGLSGYWSGPGVISMSNGSREHIRCKAIYAVNDSGKELNQIIRCASDSYRLEISGSIICNGGAISGTWNEATRHATSNITGRASNAEIQATIDGVGFFAGVQVRFQGDTQSVSIRTKGSDEVADVFITMRKV